MSWTAMITPANALRKTAGKVHTALLRGRRFRCPACDTGFRRFRPAGIVPRPNALCPGCGSLERHRLLIAALEKLWSDGRLPSGGRMLHVAPEPALAGAFRRSHDYVSVDLDGSRAMMAMDLTALRFQDEHFDCVVCNHVLEHIPDDRKAISELFRVMKPGGWGSLQVPMKGETTLEDPTVTDPEERLRRYGQEDHVRPYGQDYAVRLAQAGFEIVELKKAELLEPAEAERLSVACEEGVLLVRKPCPGAIE